MQKNMNLAAACRYVSKLPCHALDGLYGQLRAKMAEFGVPETRRAAANVGIEDVPGGTGSLANIIGWARDVRDPGDHATDAERAHFEADKRSLQTMHAVLFLKFKAARYKPAPLEG